MKTNPNKIIIAVALITALTSVMCACDKKKPEQTVTTTSQVQTSQNEPVTELTTEKPALPSTEAVTTEVATSKPSTTVQKPQKPIKPTTTAAPEETTSIPAKEPLETTTRHANAIANAFITADKMVSYRLLSKDEINEIAQDMAESSDIYYVRLQDGTKTYYMAVDLQTAQAMALSNPAVLRELCKQLDEKQKAMTDGDKEYVLMDYTHLVGELEVHYLGYLLTGALGAEDGALASFYRSCKVADLNIDESRFGPIINIIGAIYG